MLIPFNSDQRQVCSAFGGPSDEEEKDRGDIRRANPDGTGRRFLSTLVAIGLAQEDGCLFAGGELTAKDPGQEGVKAPRATAPQATSAQSSTPARD